MNEHVQKCNRYLRFKSKPQKAEFHPLLATHPIELVHIDFLILKLGETDKDINVLVGTDHFTHYAKVYVPPL